MRDRMGPTEVGFHGLLQPVADGLKLLLKEDIILAGANKIIFALAPMLSLTTALIGFAVIPFGEDDFTIFGLTLKPYVADLNIGLLFIRAFSSVGAYGILLGGWASNSKYSLLGGLRSAAQVISYELSLGLSLVGVILLTGSLSTLKIGASQAGGLWHLHAFALPFPQIIAFVFGWPAAVPRVWFLGSGFLELSVPV